jgi:hypothetical protein
MEIKIVKIRNFVCRYVYTSSIYKTNSMYSIIYKPEQIIIWSSIKIYGPRNKIVIFSDRKCISVLLIDWLKGQLLLHDFYFISVVYFFSLLWSCFAFFKKYVMLTNFIVNLLFILFYFKCFQHK